jgi:hypothetical protein
MAVELIITSVRKGLDGGSGYQPVLRTRDLKPAVAERLQLRSGYSHPFPHGDRRNPVVHVHRIERVAGDTLHVLARICDAGSDHTGRSNFLAHFVAMDDAEARRKPAGPAEVTRRMTFKTSWDEPAREADPPTVVGGDRQPTPCQAWKAAGLDPGIAGDLAEAAMAGRAVTLVSRETDDVLALFADALALVAPAKRWQVTFNTCSIEPFDGTWQAIRGDLPQARGARSAPGVIDLTTNPRGGDGAYAAYARGAAAELPWQQSAKPTEQVGGTSTGSGGGGRPPQTTALSNGPMVAPPEPPGGKGPPTAKRRPGIRNLEQDPDVTGADDPGRLAAVGRWLMWSVLVLLLILPLAVGGVVLLRPDLLPTSITPSSVAALPANDGTPAVPSVDLGEEDRARREREQEREEKQRRQEHHEKVAADAKAAAEAQAAEVRRKEEEARLAAMRAERESRERDAKKNRAAEAFAALKKLPAVVVQDLVPSLDIEDGRVIDVDLGPFDFEALVEPEFALAIPKDSYDGAAFNAWVDEVPGGRGTWHIVAASRPVDGGAAQPLHLATILARDGNVHIAAANAKASKNPLFKLLRRSVLLVKARDPAQAAGKAAVQQAIQLVRPAAGVLQWQVSLLQGTKQLSLPRPSGVTVKAGQREPPALPPDTEITYEVRFDYPLQYDGGKPLEKPVVRAFQSATFCPLLRCPPPNNQRPEQPEIGIDVSISFDEAAIGIQPEVRGPGANAVDLQKLAEVIGKKDKDREKWFNDTQIGPVKLDAKAIGRQPVQTFRGSLAEKKILGLINHEEYRASMNQFFEKKDWFAGEKDENGTPIDRVGGWSKLCTEMRERATKAKDPAELQAVAAEWKNKMVARLEAWLSHYERQLRDRMEKWLNAFKPLANPATVILTRLVSPAFDADGKRYDVVLAIQQDGKARPHGNSSSPDLD